MSADETDTRWHDADVAHRALVAELNASEGDGHTPNHYVLRALGVVSIALELRALREHLEQKHRDCQGLAP